jgi:ribosomal protein S27AE
MSESYEDLGGVAAEIPKASAPVIPKHRWKFLQAWGITTVKHHCSRCGTTRVRVNHTDRFPTVRYTTLAGAITEGKAPPCQH